MTLDKCAKARVEKIGIPVSHEIISLLYTTHDTKHIEETALSVCFDREGLIKFTANFGYLKLVSPKQIISGVVSV